MHRPFAFFLAVALMASASATKAFAQDPNDETYYDQQYDDPDAPYDDYDAEQPYDQPYDDSYDQPVEPEAGSIDTFYGTLAPYGRWVRSAQFGLIWVPSRAVVGASFVPYASGGSWQYTDVGWMFASEWDWGWAPFHYGRWYRDPGFGWAWVPGSVWAPAWVDWRFGAGVVGWAPLPPRHHRTVWVFASARDIHRRHIGRYVYRDAPRYYRMTAPVRYRHNSGRTYWFSGPRRAQIERVAKIRVQQIRVRPPRAGVVARIRLDGRRARQERVAPPRDRAITSSRRALPNQRQRPAAQPRPDARNRQQRDREQRDRNAQQQREQRDRNVQQQREQRDRNAQQQRDRNVQQQRDREQQQRDRNAQEQQRDRNAQEQRARNAQEQRDRNAQQQRDRNAQEQRNREQQQRDREQQQRAEQPRPERATPAPRPEPRAEPRQPEPPSMRGRDAPRANPRAPAAERRDRPAPARDAKRPPAKQRPDQQKQQRKNRDR